MRISCSKWIEIAICILILYRAASAIAANTMARAAFGAGFPLFVVPMFRNLGIQWAGTLLGCIATVMIPIPFAFYFYGPRIRAKSKMAPSLPVPKPAEPKDEEKAA